MYRKQFEVVLVAGVVSMLFSHSPLKSIDTSVIDVFNINHNYSEIEITDIQTPTPTNAPKQISPTQTPFPKNSPSVTPKVTSAPKKPKATPTGPYASLVTNIHEYLSSQEGTYGIYFVSLTDGQRFGINENREFIAASTIKVPVSLYLYNQAASRKINLNTKVSYTENDYEEGTGSIQYEEIGTEFTLRELSKRSIEISDNVAVNMLINHVGYENILNYLDSIVKHSVSREGNLVTPKDMAAYLKVLLDSSQRNKLYKELLDYLLNTEYNDRLPLYLPSEVHVAHKIGSQVRVVNDVGIVFAEKPYILCIFSEDVDEYVAPLVLADLSKMVYDFTQK